MKSYILALCDPNESVESITLDNGNGVIATSIFAKNDLFRSATFEFTEKINMEETIKILTELPNWEFPEKVQILTKEEGEKCFSLIQGNYKGGFTRITRDNVVVNLIT